MNKQHKNLEPISIETLGYYKVLPFTLYDSTGRIIFNKLEELTDNKMLILNNFPQIFKEVEKPKVESESQVGFVQENIEDEKSKSEMIVEYFDLPEIKVPRVLSNIDCVNVENYKGPINRRSIFSAETQIKIKTVYIQALKLFAEENYPETFDLFDEIAKKIKDEIEDKFQSITMCSQLLFLGTYSNSHSLNVASLAAALGIKLHYKDTKLTNLIMAALLHDIGKQQLHNVHSIKEHCKIGYNIIKKHFNFSKEIAVAILEHHENNDGSGYPQGLSGKQIDIIANIIHICNTFDNLLFNKTHIKIKNSREALREMLNCGTSLFLPDLFYTFIHMFSYNDTVPLEDMIFE